MKTFLSLFGTAIVFQVAAVAQDASSLPSTSPVPPSESAVIADPATIDLAPAEITSAEETTFTGTRLDNTQLDALLGAIALYPDALIALILPASTVSSDVVLAARYLNAGGDTSKLDEQPWDDSVRALARYPEVVKWMDENLTWTKQLGEAFVAQPADVMNAVQRLRLKARAVGSLVDTPQHQVVYDNSTIAIVPAQPDVIYVPSYDPDIVYVSRPTYYTQPFFSFGPAYATGFWLSYNVDWHRHRVWCIDRPHRETHWREHHQHWHRPNHYRPSFTARHDHVRPWTPRHTYKPSRTVYHRNTRIARPHVREGRVITGHGSTRWDRNFTRPAHATGERFPQPPSRGPRSTVSSSTIPQLPLADPLPHALPSPLPEAPQAVAPTTVTPRERNRHVRGRDHNGTSNQRAHRFDHNTRTRNHGSDIRRHAPAQPRIVDAATPRSPLGPRSSVQSSYHPRRHAPPATPAVAPTASISRRPAPAATAPAPAPTTHTAPAATTPPARGGDNRRFSLPRDTHPRNPALNGGRRGGLER